MGYVLSILTAVCLSAVYFALLGKIERSWRMFLVGLIVLFFSPWIWVLILEKPAIGELVNTKPLKFSLLSNVDYITSAEFLFFKNDNRLFWGTGEHGFLLPSLILLILLGIWLCANTKKHHLILKSFLILLFVSFVSIEVVGIFSVFLILPHLTFFAAIGLLTLYNGAYKNHSKFYAVVSLILTGWFLYEGLRFLRVMQVTQNIKL